MFNFVFAKKLTRISRRNRARPRAVGEYESCLFVSWFCVQCFAFFRRAELRPACILLLVVRSSQSIKIGIDISIDKSIKIGKSDLIDIDCIDQSVEIDDSHVSFIDLSRFYWFHRFILEDTSVLLFIQKWKLISHKQWICWQLSCS